MSAIAGFGGRVLIGGSIFRVQRWAVDWKTDNFDVTTTENNGYYNYLTGIKDADIDFDAYWDTTDNPFSAGLNIGAGTTGFNLTVRLQKTVPGSENWIFPQVLITDVRNEGSVRDVIRYSFHARYTGVLPTTTVPTVPVD